MKIDDLFAKKIPLKINDEVVENAFIQELAFVEIANLQNVLSQKDNFKRMKSLGEIIKLSIINNEEELIFKDKKLSNIFIMDVANQIIEVNTPQGK